MKYNVEFLGGPKDGQTLNVSAADWKKLLASATKGPDEVADGQVMLIAIGGHSYYADVVKGRRVLRLVGPRLPPMPGGNKPEDKEPWQGQGS